MGKLDNHWALLPVDAFKWSVRTTNCFEKKGIITLGDLLKRTEADLLQIRDFGLTSLKEVTRVLSRVGLSLKGQTSTTPQLLPRVAFSFSLEEKPPMIEGRITRDIEEYVVGLEEKAKIIFCMRYGFRQPPKTLQEVGDKFGLTRERIRQIQLKMQKKLSRTGIVNKKDLLLYLQHQHGASLHVLFPNLASLFTGQAPTINHKISGRAVKNDYLVEFLEDYTGVKRDTYQVAEKFVSGLPIETVQNIFLEVSSPLSLGLFKQELQSLYGLPESSLDYAVYHLTETSKKCRITENGIVPMNLPRVHGVTHILLNFPNGCHWRTVNKILAHLKIIRTFRGRGGKARQTADNTFSANENIYLYGKGVWRHRKFLDLDDFNIENILKTTVRIIKMSPRESIGLKEVFSDIANRLKIRISFYDLRHVLKEYGSKHGVYFDGRSGTHTLSLQRVQERVTNAKVILNIFREQNKALKFEDIKLHLQSHISPGIIQLLIGEFLESNVLIRVDPSTYCLPKIAFAKIDRVAISNKINGYLLNYELAEHDFLRERLNAELNLSYSKYFYNAFVKYYAKENAWQHSIDLSSAKTLRFRRTVDVLRDCLKSRETFEKDCKFLLRFYGISRLTLSRYASNNLRQNQE